MKSNNDEIDWVLEYELEILNQVRFPTRQGFKIADEALAKLELIHPDRRLIKTASGLLISLQELEDLSPFEDKYIHMLETLRDLFFEKYVEYDFRRIAKQLHFSEDRLDKIETMIVRNLIERISNTPQLIHSIEPREFEQVVGQIFSRMGYRVELTKQTRDGGYDLIAIDDQEFGLKFLIECKKYGSGKPVGVSVVRNLAYIVEKEKANKGIIVSTSRFTKDAKVEAGLRPYQLDLKGMTDVLRLIEKYKN